MNINGEWYSEPELAAYVKELESRISELEDKHFIECGQVAHYDDELRQAKRLLSLAVPMIAHMKFMGKHYCGVCKYWDKETHERTCPKHCNADDYVLGGTTFEWRYADEALALIGGGENETK